MQTGDTLSGEFSLSQNYPDSVNGDRHFADAPESDDAEGVELSGGKKSPHGLIRNSCQVAMKHAGTRRDGLVGFILVALKPKGFSNQENFIAKVSARYC